MTQSSHRFIYEERIGVRFGSAQHVLAASITAIRRYDAGLAAHQDDGTYLFVNPRWARHKVRAVVSLSVVPGSDVTAVQIELVGNVGSHWLQRRRCRSMVRQLLARAQRVHRDVNSNGPKGGHRASGGGGGPMVRVPIPVRVDDSPNDSRRRRSH